MSLGGTPEGLKPRGDNTKISCHCPQNRTANPPRPAHTQAMVRQATGAAFSASGHTTVDEFDPESAPVALRLRADSVLSTPASVARHTERLVTIAAATRHLSITLTGADGARQELAEHLRDMLVGTAAELSIAPRPSTPADVLPRCPLLVPEQGCCEWSETGLMVPAETAWFPQSVRLTDFLDRDGAVDRSRLGTRLDDIVDAAEACFDAARWPTPAMQHDAWMNRRVAVCVSGHSELHEYFAYTLSALHQLTGWISARLQGRSMWHASRRRPLPAILEADPSRGMPQGRLRDEWSHRWRRAVDATAVRHRNLLAIQADALAYRSLVTAELVTELLPLLVHADVVGRAGSLALGKDESVDFGKRLEAALQQRHALDQIAKHV